MRDHTERKIKCKRLPWYKRHVDAWRGGTRGMSLELRGFYSECLDAMWDRQGPIEKDEAKLAVLLCCNPRSIRKLLPQLIALGKIVETPEGYINPRMLAEISEVKSKSIERELEPKVPEKPLVSTRDIEEEPRPRKTEAEQLSAAKTPSAPLPDLKDLSEKLCAAANGAIANPATCAGLLHMGTPIMWLDQGCDLERDVLPTVSALGKQRHGAGIRSWNYFTSAVTEAKARREQGIPPAPHLAPQKPIRPSRWRA